MKSILHFIGIVIIFYVGIGFLLPAHNPSVIVQELFFTRNSDTVVILMFTESSTAHFTVCYFAGSFSFGFCELDCILLCTYIHRNRYTHTVHVVLFACLSVKWNKVEGSLVSYFLPHNRHGLSG